MHVFRRLSPFLVGIMMVTEGPLSGKTIENIPRPPSFAHLGWQTFPLILRRSRASCTAVKPALKLSGLALPERAVEPCKTRQ